MMDFMRSRNMKEDMAEDRHLWRLGVDGRLYRSCIYIYIRIKQCLQLKPSITLGNHQCMGAAPGFINRGIEVIKIMEELFKVNKCSIIDFEIMTNRRVEEVKASIRKCFNDASMVKVFLLSDIIGINKSKLISNPIRALNKEFDEIVIRIPSKRVVKKIILS